MPDITMCAGGNCIIKKKCYRFTAKPSKLWQSYFMNVPCMKENVIDDNYCEFFIDNKKKKGE